MKKGNREVSILQYLWFLGLTTFLVILVIFTALFYNILRQTKDNEELLASITELNVLYSELYDISTELTVLSRTGWNEEMITNHVNQSEYLQEIIDDFIESNDLEEYSFNILRRLSNMNSFQLQLLVPKQDPENFFYNLKFVQQAFEAHISEFYHLIRNETRHATTTYALEESRLFKVGMLLLCILFAFIVVEILSFQKFGRKLRNSINNTIDNLKSIAHHEWDIPDLPEDRNFIEFRQLSKEVNYEKKELYTYFREQERKKELEIKLIENDKNREITKKLLVTTEMEMLKNQINPHFIFNSLHQIGMATLLKEPKDVLQMVEYTGNILRYSLYNKDTLVNLDEELYIVKQYIGLQNICIPDSVKLEITQNNENTMDYYIMPMCLQPIVENSIKHASKENRCLDINVDIYRDNKALVVAITDDGPGIEDINHVLEKSKKSIGLKNIARRMTLLYGRDDLMRIDSKKNEFTRITLIFPEKIGDEYARIDS